MIKKMLMISSLFITGCRFPWPGTSIERCVIHIADERGIITDSEGREFSLKSKCRCHQYEITSDHIGIVGESKDYDILYCQDGILFRPESWVTIRAWLSELQSFANQDNENGNTTAP